MGSHTTQFRPRQKAASPDATARNSQRVMDGIRRIVQVLRVSSRAAEQELGLSAAQLFVLQKLTESDAISLNELAAKTLTHQSSVSVVVQKLVDRQLVSRSPSEQDARRLVISLTASGRRLVGNAPPPAQERLIQAIEQLPPRQRKQLAELLELLAASSTDTSLAPPMFFEERNT